jgi:hypothetical protein
MLSIRNDKEVTPLPIIYNLRSSISQGITAIEWSANQMETNECCFALWYSPEIPIDVTRQPDETVLYLSAQTEYRTTFQQKASAYITIVAMRPGKEPEYGTFHELFLDWNNTPPPAPDDALVLNTPLTAIDMNIVSINQENTDITLW